MSDNKEISMSPILIGFLFIIFFVIGEITVYRRFDFEFIKDSLLTGSIIAPLYVFLRKTIKWKGKNRPNHKN